MEAISKQFVILLFIAINILSVVNAAESSANIPADTNKNKHLELDYIEESKAPLDEITADDSFLLSYNIAHNQTVGINYGQQSFDSELINKQPSRLWLTLQFAY